MSEVVVYDRRFAPPVPRLHSPLHLRELVGDEDDVEGQAEHKHGVQTHVPVECVLDVSLPLELGQSTNRLVCEDVVVMLHFSSLYQAVEEVGSRASDVPNRKEIRDHGLSSLLTPHEAHRLLDLDHGTFHHLLDVFLVLRGRLFNI